MGIAINHRGIRLVYDGASHMGVLMSKEELESARSFLQDPSKTPKDQAGRSLRDLVDRGFLPKGPLPSIGPSSLAEAAALVDRYTSQVLIRKFCLKVTDRCNFRCTYCRGTHMTSPGPLRHMDIHTARKGLELYFGMYSRVFLKLSQRARAWALRVCPPGLSWYGGEPLLNFQTVRLSAEAFLNLPWGELGIPRESLRFSMNTNLSIMTDDMIDFLVRHDITLFASLDGPKDQHDLCRVLEDQTGTFDTAFRNLMRIKELYPRYFSRRVSIFGVLTDRHDVQRCRSFTESLGALRSVHFPERREGVFVRDPQGVIERVRLQGERMIEEMLETAKDDRSFPASPKAAPLYPFARMSFQRPLPYDPLKLTLTCPMGVDNLMVLPDGNLSICHKAEVPSIGHVEGGIDRMALANLYLSYGETVTRHCSSCWAVRLCPVCAASRITGSEERWDFINPSPAECRAIRAETAFRMRCFLALSIELPGVARRIEELAKDPSVNVGVLTVDSIERAAEDEGI
ncbi:radical SAM protein [Thermanaerovibrio velox]|nr:radical SAM protein [Thermanaerovibrio velox]